MDGEQVDLEAYVINGHNYVQLRDIGRAADFGVEYDQSTNRVLVDTSSPYTEEATASTPSGVVTIPQTDEPLRLQEGDQVLCDDGTVYEITDLRLWEEPAPLPTLAWEWPELELPKAEVRRFQSEYGDNLHIRNLYETRRMEYTIYNAAAGRTEPLNLPAWHHGAERGADVLALAGGSAHPGVLFRAGGPVRGGSLGCVPQRKIPLHRVQYQRDVTKQRPRQTGGRQTASRFFVGEILRVQGGILDYETDYQPDAHPGGGAVSAGSAGGR